MHSRGHKSSEALPVERRVIDDGLLLAWFAFGYVIGEDFGGGRWAGLVCGAGAVAAAYWQRRQA